ncbi:histidine kinase [Corynebacterium sp. c8Ua_181]|uniref:histidine kinase n=1 Tax=Corynebacterium curieae TaxID=2913500 RepID=A0A9X3RRA6_9CORY|nr:histidine kinase [Corynebacterium curieae]MCZ9306185.1 histidine kinase [Corynebacterium curieae]MDV2422950.1 histidine kinase [Corynebacterium curieae]
MKKLWPDAVRAWVGPPWRIIIPLFFWVSSMPAAEGAIDRTSLFQELVFLLYAVGVPLALWLHPKLKEYAIGFIAITLTVCILTPLAALGNAHFFPVAYCVFLIGAHSPKRLQRIWIGWIALGTLAATAASLYGRRVFGGIDFGLEGSSIGPLPAFGSVIVMAWPVMGFFYLLGTNDRKKREDQQLLIERAEMAGAVERNRIAREMHDIVAHNLAGVIALADGARFAAAKNPAAATEALETIASTSRDSLKQMRGLLSVLRDGDSRADTKAPGASDIAGLISEARRTGFDITVHGLEDLPTESDELYQFTVYRVVQELLTNMIKHSRDKRGVLRFRSTGNGLVLNADNPAARTPNNHNPGYGLIGMSERVKAYGGSVETRTEDGHFFITVEVPND